MRYFYYDTLSGTWSTQYGDLAKFEYISADAQFRLTETDGTIFLFHDMTHVDRPGGFVQMSSPGGTVLSVTQESGSRIIELQRTVTVGSESSQESFLYEYITSGDLDGHFLNVTARRNLNGGAWTNVSRVTYSYYADGDSSGSLGDLRTATKKLWQSGAWVETGTDYYRYYKSGASRGNAHGIKYACGPEAFARLSASVSDPFTASDAVVSLYADYYYEYNTSNRVILERVFAGSMTIKYGYGRNPRYPVSSGSSSSSSSPPPGMNAWIYKTIETQPDDSVKIVYSNFAGLPMLSVLKPDINSSDMWIQFFKYNEDGKLVWFAHPSAITGYSEAYDDLLHYDSSTGKYQYLRDNDGLIDVTEYYGEASSSSSVSSSSSSSGTLIVEPAGYAKAQKVQHGQLATPITVRSWKYTVFTAGTSTIYPIYQEIQYPDETDVTREIVTSYEYTYHTGTTQVAQQTTILPVIPTTQNGSGVANSRKSFFDDLGYQTWSMDERGFITKYVYDTLNGALRQRIDDVQTSSASNVPPGWSTPTGGGLNLITDFESDDQGRVTQELGPTHVIDIGGTATTIRRASWAVYDDASHTVRTAQGYATGSPSSYTYTLVNPVTIHQADKSNKPVADIQAVRPDTSGKLLPTDTFPQNRYTRWKTYQYTDCCLLASQRVYHSIPDTGIGASGTNFDETQYGYDLQKRRNLVRTPGGTISFSVFDIRSLVIASYVGTNDAGASASNPTGGGAPGNNMVLVTQNQYDNGVVGGDGNLTLVKQWVDGTTSRSTSNGYDWRDRRVNTTGEIDVYVEYFLDNLSRTYRVDRRNTSASGVLIGRQETKFDDLGRTFQTIRYGVNPSTGAIGNSLIDNTWFDAAGNVAKSLPAGSNLWTKVTYDSLGRSVATYAGYGTDSTYNDIFTVIGDVIMEQGESAFDNASNLIQVTRRLRYHDAPASQTGGLGTPSSSPKARVTYSANYPDPLGRTKWAADYGTNGGASFSRPSIAPASSDTILVSGYVYGNAGDLNETVDPAGMKSGIGYDDAGRRTQVTENATIPTSSSSSGTGCGASADTLRTTRMTYTPDGQLATLEALNASTGNQVTTYVYGTTLSDSGVATSLLLRSVIYSDSTGGSDRVWLGYNRQAQRTSLTDQNGTVHQYVYDLLGRMTQDYVPTLASGIDGAVRRLQTTYDVRGLAQKLTSFNSPAVGLGTIVNEVQFSYNDFAQSIQTFQSHTGAVNTSTSPSVQMGYASGVANTIRPLSLTYPNGRTVTYDYGVSTSIDNQIGRIASLIDSGAGSPHLADYSYLGIGAVVKQEIPDGNLQYTLIDSGSSDIYGGLDRFGRVQNLRWINTSTSDVLSQVKYGYDRASNRIWRENPTDPDRHYDWKYTHDGLHRLKDGQRGTLNTMHTGITSPQFAQCWTLDETGNWSGFKQSDYGTYWSLEQTRTANPVNELTAINASVGPQWATPVYDKNGNMTSIPHPTSTRPSLSNLTANQWATLTTDQWSLLPVAPTLSATYDAWNRMVQVVDPTASAIGEVVQENIYDARGYRIVMKTYTAGTLAETRHAYFTDSWQNIEERQGSSTTPDRQFVWGTRYIDDLISRTRSTGGGTLNERLYALQDANWNVTAVANIAGDVQERYEYDPYGVITILAPDFTARSTSNSDWETTYCGYRQDITTTLFAVRHRIFTSQLGVWLSRDPKGYGSSSSLYSYDNSSPLSIVDPLGLEGHYGGVIPSGQDALTGVADTMRLNKNNLNIIESSTDWLSGDPLRRYRDIPDYASSYRKTGCRGTVGALLGRTVINQRAQQDCFDLLGMAQAEQKRWVATGRCNGMKTCNGKTSQPRIFAVTNTYDPKSFQNGLPYTVDYSGRDRYGMPMPKRVKFNFERMGNYDYQLYDDKADVWWGGNSEWGPPKVWDVRLILPEHLEEYNGSHQPSYYLGSDLSKIPQIKVTAYCVICEGDGEEFNK